MPTFDIKPNKVYKHLQALKTFKQSDKPFLHPSSSSSSLSFSPSTTSSQIKDSERLPIPPNRYTHLKKAWLGIYGPVYEHMKVDIRMNLESYKVELKTRADTPDVSNLSKSADFVQAFMLGSDISDAIRLLGKEELVVD
ncbi:unnamed protein product [Eruca vesicaria subsp. sativa]|uniref:Uncharacterized protein n=1 Tax=Eruca vesicaria subsp. sativa TaxID=29727 RepID=A0ABC8LMI8_ERUVS|nr:unnamed protein product [Eruca vesicaria subsp. sativa]